MPSVKCATDYATWPGCFLHGRTRETFMKFINFFIFQDLHVLDAGCGTGRYSKALTELGVGKLSLLDASPAMLKVAVNKLNAAIEKNGVEKVIEAVLPNLPFQD